VTRNAYSWPRFWWLFLLAVAAMSAVLAILATERRDHRPPYTFTCNSTTGVYTVPGQPPVLMPYDPACVFKPDQSPPDWYQGG